MKSPSNNGVDSDKRCEKYTVFPIVSVARPISIVGNSFVREALVYIGVYAIRLLLGASNQNFDLTSEIEQEQLVLGDVEATRIIYTAKIVDPFGRKIEISNTQYLVLEGSLAYIITLSMPAELAENYLQPYSEAAETFRLIE